MKQPRTRTTKEGNMQRGLIMAEKLYKYDPDESLIEELDNPEAIEIYLNEVFQSGDPAYISDALGIVARSKSGALTISGPTKTTD